MGFTMAGGGWVVVVVWVWLGRWVVEDHRVQHVGEMVTAWCVCCACKANAFRKRHYRRLNAGQFTEVGCKTNMSEQCIIVGYLGRIALDDDRSGGPV